MMARLAAMARQRVSDWRLPPMPDSEIAQLHSPNNSGGGNSRRFVVLHHTGTNDAQSPKTWMCDRSSKVSAHYLIGRDGKVWQLGGHDLVMWHAGKSRWGDVEGLNRHSVGIEFVNQGLRSDPAKMCRDFGLTRDQVVFDEANPKCCWDHYPEPQLRAGIQVVKRILADCPQVEEIVRHRDISPWRKVDVGPNFPLDRFRRLL